jgi:hypothetical protein
MIYKSNKIKVLSKRKAASKSSKNLSAKAVAAVNEPMESDL